jgi:hypothetical protein
VKTNERVVMIQRIAREISEVYAAYMEFVLHQFGFGKYNASEFDSQYERAIWILGEREDDEAFSELYAPLQSVALSDAGTRLNDDEGLWAHWGTFRLFISHTIKHKERAAKLATALEPHTVFTRDERACRDRTDTRMAERD